MDLKQFKIVVLLLLLSTGIQMNLIRSVEKLQLEFDRMVQQKFSYFNEKNIQEKYVEVYNIGAIGLQPVNPLDIAKEFSNQLANELQKKMESLKRAVDFAEEEARKYKWNPDIKPEEVIYIDSKKLTDDDSRLVEHPLFKTKVIVNQSSVHIPTEIFEEDELILNTITWASKLDGIFSKNFQTLRYQYFASTTGVVLQYPGMKWRKNDPDMFDVRRRQWYVQGASSPKDVMILIDTSGSMHGISIKLTMTAVIKLIDTMGENDYIAVAQFPGVAWNKTEVVPHFLFDNPYQPGKQTSCFKTFVQANKRNKIRLFKQISQLKAKGIAHLDDALSFAVKEFQLFDNTTNSATEGANCNRLIVVFTDSGDNYDWEKIRNLVVQSNNTKNLRIFIYYVGEEIIPIDAIKNRTCDYRGYFGHINAFGAVNNIIDKYSTVNHYHTVHRENMPDINEFRVGLAPVHDDGLHYPDDFPPMGLGLMTSLTMPVYNRSGNGSFLGLLGTDMTVAFMDELVPHNKLGPNGYAFAINTNGYIIFHPELKNQLGWMRDPPNVDLVEIEFNSDTKIKVREKIINCASSNGTQSGQDDVKGLIKVPDEIHVYEKVRTYAYSGIPFSKFAITVVSSKYNKYYPKFSTSIKFVKLDQCTSDLCQLVVYLPDKNNVNLEFSSDVFLYAEVGLITKCKLPLDNIHSSPAFSTTIYQRTTPSLHKTTSHLVPISTMGSTISGSIAILENINMTNSISSSSTLNENVTMGFQVPKFSDQLLTILSTLQNQSNDKCPQDEGKRLVIDLYILESIAKSISKPEYVKSMIVTTFTGLSMVYPKSEKHVYKDLFNNSTNSAIFQRTFDMNEIIFYTTFNQHSLPKDNSKTIDRDIMVFKSLSAALVSNRKIPVAVLGLTWNQSSIANFLLKYDVCNKSRLCYLIEDGGYVISVNDIALSYQIGHFFGDVHPIIMSTLLNRSIFKRVEDFDYQAICAKDRDEDAPSSGNKLRPIMNLINIPILVFKRIIYYLENIFLSIKLMIHLLLLQMSSAQETTATDNKNISCIKKFYRYYLQNNSLENKPQEIVQMCENCSFTFIIHKMALSNLIVLSFDNSCSVNCSNIKVDQVPRYPIKDPGPDICQISYEPRYRLRPEYKCYNFNPDEDFTKCNSPKSYFVRRIYLITFIFITKGLLLINDLYL